LELKSIYAKEKENISLIMHFYPDAHISDHRNSQ